MVSRNAPPVSLAPALQKSAEICTLGVYCRHASVLLTADLADTTNSTDTKEPRVISHQRFSNRFIVFMFAALTIVASVPGARAARQQRPKPPKSVRVYVFDCGWIKGLNPSRFGYSARQIPTSAPGVATVDIPVPCFLIVDPKGTLMWDVGVISDSDFPADGSPSPAALSTLPKP